jgi:hypothetical protein
MAGINWIATSVFVAFFALVTVMGFVAAALTPVCAALGLKHGSDETRAEDYELIQAPTPAAALAYPGGSPDPRGADREQP